MADGPGRATRLIARLIEEIVTEASEVGAGLAPDASPPLSKPSGGGNHDDCCRVDWSQTVVRVRS